MRFGWVMSAGIAALLAGVRGAGTAPKPPAVPELLFLHDDWNAQNQVFAYTVARGGRLASVAGSPFATTDSGNTCSGQCNTLAYAAGPAELFASGAHGISAFRVAANGALARVVGSPFGGQSLIGLGVVSLDTSTFVYGAAFGSDQVYGYQVQEDGTLSPVPGSPFSTGHTPVGLTAIQDMVFVVSQGDGTLSAFKAQEDGSLVVAPGSPYDAQAGAAFNCTPDVSGHFLYVGNEAAALVYGFSIDPDDASLSLLPGGPFRASTSNNASFVVSGASKITYVFSDTGAPNYQAFRRKSTGALVGARKPFDAGFASVNVGAMDPAGKLIALASTQSGVVSTYRIDGGTGKLKPAGSQFETFQNVNGIVFVGN